MWPYLVQRRAPDQVSPLLEDGDAEVREDNRPEYPERSAVRRPCVVIVGEEGGLDQFQGEDGDPPCATNLSREESRRGDLEEEKR